MSAIFGADVRWTTTAGIGLRFGALLVAVISIVIGAGGFSPRRLAGLVVLAGVASFQTADVQPRHLSARSLLLAEAGAALIVVLATAAWSSPFVAYLAVPVVLIGLRSDAWLAGAVALVAVGALGVVELLNATPVDAGAVAQTLIVLAIATGIGAVGGSFVREAEQEHEETLGRIEQLGHVNAMLSTLHDLVRSMPAPLSVDQIVEVIRAQLAELFDADATALLMSAGAGGGWRPVYAEGVRLPTELRGSELPEPLRMRGPSQRPVVLDSMSPGEGLWDQARCGVYLWLWSRGQPSGLLALEHREEGQVDPEDRDVLERLGVPLALAIDNAVWFSRLRTIGAEEERQRIGAQLHDQFAQSLAYVAMELDRTVRRHPDDDQLERLHGDVRTTLSDLRATLRDLRLKVTEDRSLATVLSEHAETYGERFGVAVDVVHEGDEIRPPMPVEQQLLRVAQDLMALAQREMGATRIRVTYQTAPGRVRLEVLDDGRGIPEADLGAEARHMLQVLRERADAIGAQMELVTVPDEGGEVTVTLRGLL
ncbi:MAG: histidine kinase [Nitriliruptorales bacterium]|nr:histidine kinase [Nitriliruptorales bacterium]